MDLASSDARAGEQQTLSVPTTSGGEQKVLGVDAAVVHHARLVLGEQDRVVSLVGEPAQRVLRPGDRDAGVLAAAAAVTPRSQEHASRVGVLLAGLFHP
ncbi:MAG TPA: hypothetical protein VG365_11835 [Solirubrobacteraceae bacterium]|nr:hypothetical protein [Solirubrobacteraceae bacterium]